jgi:Arc/MetJ family transcription regulator
MDRNRKHTTIDIDVDLLREAAAALGTVGTIATIHAALSEVVRRRLRIEFLNTRSTLTVDDLKQMRAHRFAVDPAPERADVDD